MMDGGPYDQLIVPISTVDGEWPVELRLAPYGTFNGKVDADVYRYVEVEKFNESRFPVWAGSYRYIGNIQSAVTLVTVWTKE